MMISLIYQKKSFSFFVSTFYTLTQIVHSTSLPREKQAEATLQRSEAARCLSQENDAR